jgi:predicted ABC-type ATPase
VNTADTAPNLVIVIGANGSGKTTWSTASRDLLPKPFYNADSIAEGLGDANSDAMQREARKIVDAAIEQDLREQRSFGFESTYSGRSRPGIVRREEARVPRANRLHRNATTRHQH